MKKIILALALLPMIAACQESKPDRVSDSTEFSYFYDGRTKLCFASIARKYNQNYAMTNVPCSREVVDLINGVTSP